MSSTPYKFDLPAHHKSIIKVIGVGGGGSNAVNHMFNQGIKDVEFVVCNTDAQALKSSPVPTKLQIGADLTEGLGAGANPEVGRNAAMESKEDIREFLSDGTKMVFITAGMGGGTGTGAAPVIAKIANELGILTVGIVTLPFKFEGKKKTQSAKLGITELKAFCDTVLVIVNDKLFEMNNNLTMTESFHMVDNVLTTGAKSIAEIITVTSHVNVDFEDVKTVMKNSGAAVMGSAIAEGGDRAIRAAENAICSPLLDNTDILGAKKILLSLASGMEAELTMMELSEITSYIEEKAGEDIEMIWGQGFDPELGKGIRVTIIATGFDHAYEKEDYGKEKTTVYNLDRDKKPESREMPKQEASDFFVYEKTQDRVEPARQETYSEPKELTDSRTSYQFLDAPKKGEVPKQAKSPFLPVQNKAEAAKTQSEETPSPQTHFGFVEGLEEKKRLLQQQSQERIKRLKGLNAQMDYTPNEFKDKLEVPAYVRRQMPLNDYPHSSEKKISRFNLNDDNEILGNNKFLHDNVD